ncbi:MAG: NUDIX hydrolase [Ardenticatenaceae bacterium]|nr:NUDIX hydrolase [Ardenticatenaceae bacterium]MCB8991215.1 NUDIX hydrolase [Ardenticatenaceae bacterium]MCB9004185.1 NUDIX hydrolase [Ardenticatenaceae bacterium]
MFAGALFFDEQERLLILQPTYKQVWEIPGGVIELGESPREACYREVEEELGLARPPERLLCVDYLHNSADKTEAVGFVFLGGRLTAVDIAQIRLPADELASYRFLPVADALPYFSQRMQQRVAMCLEAIEAGGTFYLEDQQKM